MIFQNKHQNQKGYLALIGGAEDKKDSMIVLKSIVSLNNAKNVVVIPTATSYPVECGKDYQEAFRKLGVELVHVFDIREKKEADDPKYLELIESADMVYFTGGDQVRLVKVLEDTTLLERIRYLHLNKGLTIAGTSAGAAAASDPMTYDGDYEGLIKGTVEHARGFGFIENITIDTHFVARGRIGRMTQFLCTEIPNRGIGIGENTAILINPENIFEVVGTGIITVLDTTDISYSNVAKINPGERISIDGIKAGFLQHGAMFDINQWKVVGHKGYNIETPSEVLNNRN
jgi:cyanophycinase